MLLSVVLIKPPELCLVFGTASWHYAFLCAHQELAGLLASELAALSAPHSFTWHREVAGLQVGPGTKTLHQFKPGCGSVPPFSTLKLAGEGWSPRHVLGAGSRHAAPQPVLLVPLKTGFGALLKPLKSYCCLPMLLQRMCLKYRKSFCRNTREFGNQGLSYTILAEGWPAFSLALSWDPPLP